MKPDHLLEPDHRFLEQSKSAFLASVRLLAARKSQASVIVRYGAVIFACLAISFSGMSAYADMSDAGIDSPLYPAKRIAENVRLAAAQPSKKAAVARALAERRIKEMRQAKEAQEQALADSLANDYQSDIRLALTSLSAQNTTPTQARESCGKIARTVKKYERVSGKSAAESTINTIQKVCGTNLSKSVS